MKTLAYSPLLNKIHENNRTSENSEAQVSGQPLAEQIIDFLDWALQKFTPYFFLAAIPYIGYLIIKAVFFL
ncbi:MAG: hypothetical protein LRY73_00340 [Bacillus sp. (in: Bacteria)]|nr:hypothetical protein [Bacillus sp. (in: firmicutes)]